MVTPKRKLDEMLEDVKTLVNQIHERVAPRVDDPFFQATALGGPTSWISRSTSLK
jgi:hypothetical protein